MSRLPSDATQLRTLKGTIKGLERELDNARATAIDYRIRATKAEQEVAAWKERFDILLRRDDKKEVTHV